MRFKLISQPQGKSYIFILKDGNIGGLNNDVQHVFEERGGRHMYNGERKCFLFIFRKCIIIDYDDLHSSDIEGLLCPNYWKNTHKFFTVYIDFERLSGSLPLQDFC